MRAPLVPWPRAAVGVVVGATVVFLSIGVIVWHDDRGLAIDNVFNRWIHRSFDVYTRHDMVQLTDAWVIITAAGLIAGIALLARRWDVAVLAVLAPVVATGLTEYVFKPLFARSVPLVARLTGIEAEAYPSGHETAVSSVLVVLALVLLRSRLATVLKAAGLAALVAYFVVTVFGLVGQYYHYLTDTIGALAVALAVVLGGALGLDRVGRHSRERPSTSAASQLT
jgi:membrane-associated phospholipid phosphatase